MRAGIVRYFTQVLISLVASARAKARLGLFIFFVMHRNNSVEFSFHFSQSNRLIFDSKEFNDLILKHDLLAWCRDYVLGGAMMDTYGELNLIQLGETIRMPIAPSLYFKFEVTSIEKCFYMTDFDDENIAYYGEVSPSFEVTLHASDESALYYAINNTINKVINSRLK